MVHGSTRTGTCQVKLLCGIGSNELYGGYVPGNVEDRMAKLSFARGQRSRKAHSAIRSSDEMSQFLNKARFREENVFAVFSFRAARTDLSGCTQSEPSQGSVPFDSTPVSDFSLGDFSN